MADPAAPDAVLAEVVRRDWGRLIALLVARFRRLDLAEDALGDAVATAARDWPGSGAPANPSGWLMTVAKNRGLDRLRSEMVAARVTPLLATDARTSLASEQVLADPGDEVRDELLRLVFCCVHPALDRPAAAALTLRLVLGVPTADIARLFLVSEQAMAARITRAKRKITAAAVPLVIPPPHRIGERLDVLAEIAYLAFTAGYAPGSGPDLLRVELAAEAIRLLRVVRDLLPDSGLPHRRVLDALLALMLLQHSRRDARTGPDGTLVLLPDQDRGRWRHAEIAEAVDLLGRLLQTGADDPAALDDPAAGADPAAGGDRGSRRAEEYLLQALIAAEHAVAPTAADTDWDRIAGWYTELEALTGSPVVRLNRAVAVAEATGPGAGPAAALELVAELDESLPNSHRLPAVRAELLLRTHLRDRTHLAAEQFDLAIARCTNQPELAHLRRRRESLG